MKESSNEIGGLVRTDDSVDRNEDIVEINEELKALAEEYSCKYVDVYSALVNEETGEFDKAYTDDGLLPNENGYLKITDILKPIVNELNI